MAEPSSLLLVGHGSRSAAGVAECRELVETVAGLVPDVTVGCGFLEFAQPDLDTALDGMVEQGAGEVIAVPLVLLGAGHLKDDGPAALARARCRHPGAGFRYGRDLGIHPLVLEVAEERARTTVAELGRAPSETAVVLVGRGSSDPDANGDLYKVARLLWDGRGFGTVEPAFVSLAPPGVPDALERCRRLGFTSIAVVPYFLFTGILVDRIGDQAAEWAAAHPRVDVLVGPHLWPDLRLARLVLARHEEALAGDVRMNCDLCIYRLPLPGHEHKIGRPADGHQHHSRPSHGHQPAGRPAYGPHRPADDHRHHDDDGERR
ncbi:MAG: sirohydrochlorin chelatase [Actinomycetota bacterium]|nr:sirohydrochlorin chelatase [Actinomycetota bacterium]